MIIDVEGVLGDVLGVIFSPDGFYTEDLSQSKYGFLPLARINDLFGRTYGSDVVLTILTELKLGVVQEDSIQVPALLHCTKKFNTIRVYQQRAGIRFKLRYETDIISCSTFPKVQVKILQQHGNKVQLWTHGLCSFVDSVYLIIYMADNKKYIDIVVKSETVNAKACYYVRQKFGKMVQKELRESSAGSEFCTQLIRPDDLKNDISSCQLTTYDLMEVHDHFNRNEFSITGDGEHTDHVQELLYCNYLELEG